MIFAGYGHLAKTSVQRVTTRDGLAILYPPPDKPMRDDFQMVDPLMQPWYASTCSTYRNVVIVVDSSGTMSGEPLLFAQQLTRTIISSLSVYDAVAVVAYKSSYTDNVEVLGNRSHEGLHRADTAWQKTLLDAVFELNPSDRGDIGDALKRGFALLTNAKPAPGATSEAPSVAPRADLMFVISDGSDAASGSEVYEKHKGLVRIFTYQVGYTVWSDKKGSEGLRSLANDNGGVFQFVHFPQQINNVSVAYYNVQLSCHVGDAATGHTAAPDYVHYTPAPTYSTANATRADAHAWTPPPFQWGVVGNNNHDGHAISASSAHQGTSLTLSRPVFVNESVAEALFAQWSSTYHSARDSCPNNGTFAGAVAIDLPANAFSVSTAASRNSQGNAAYTFTYYLIVDAAGDIIVDSRHIAGISTAAQGSTLEVAEPGLSVKQYAALSGVDPNQNDNNAHGFNTGFNTSFFVSIDPGRSCDPGNDTECGGFGSMDAIEAACLETCKAYNVGRIKNTPYTLVTVHDTASS